MAIYKENIVDVELTSGNIHRSFLNKTIGSGDALADRFGVRVLRNGAEVSLNGTSCTGYFIRSDGATIPITGSINGSVAFVELPQACYALEGQFALAIKLSGNGVAGTMRIVDGVVSRTTTDSAVDPGTIIPSVEALIEAIEEAVASIPSDYSELSTNVEKIKRTYPQVGVVQTAQGYVHVEDNELAVTATPANSFKIYDLNMFAGMALMIQTYWHYPDAKQLYIFTDNIGNVISYHTETRDNDFFCDNVSIPINARRLYVNYATAGNGADVIAVFPYRIQNGARQFQTFEKSIREPVQPAQVVDGRYVTLGSGGVTLADVPGCSVAIYDIDETFGKSCFLESERISGTTYSMFYVTGNNLTPLTAHEDKFFTTYSELIEIPASTNRLYVNYKTDGSGVSVYKYDMGDKYANFFESFDYTKRKALFPSQLFFRNDKEIPVYKRSMLQEYNSGINMDIGLVCKVGNVEKRVVDIHEPTNFGGVNGVQVKTGQGRMIASNVKGETSIMYRDCSVFSRDVSEIESESIKVLSLGDSLTEGGIWETTPVTLLAEELEKLGISTQYIGSLARDYTDPEGNTVRINYEGHGGWRYRTFVGRESKFAGINVVIPSSGTKHEWVEGTDGTMAEIKANNPFLYPATAEDLSAYPDHCFHFVDGNTGYNKSYTEDPSLGSYVIFNPTKYFSERSITIPDVLTIALGTNEWYVGNFVLADALADCKFMIEAFRRANASMKIVVIPSNCYSMGRETEWEGQAFSLAAGVCKIVDEKIAGGDTNIFCCPLYVNGGRAFTFSEITSTENMDTNNDTQIGVTSNNVHVLGNDAGTAESYMGGVQYADGLAACVLNIIP